VKRAGIVFLGWGAWLGAMTGVQAAFRSIEGPFGVRWIEAVLLGTAAAGAALGGLLLWWLDRRDPAGERVRYLSVESAATATLVTGLALVLLGAGFGLWLILIGAGVSALGAGGLVREERARRRRERRHARAGAGTGGMP
jgi:hypothetical protein